MKIPFNIESLENKLFFIALIAALTYVYSLYYVFDGHYLYVISIKFLTMAIYSFLIVYLAYKAEIVMLAKGIASITMGIGIIALFVGLIAVLIGDSAFNNRWLQTVLTFTVPGIVVFMIDFFSISNYKKIFRITLRTFVAVIAIGFIYKTTEGSNHRNWINKKEQARKADIAFTEEYGEADSLYEHEFESENPEPSHFD